MTKIFGIKIDKITENEAIDKIGNWLGKKSGQHYIVTPNVEIIMAAQIDWEFKKVLNQADLAIPDSARLGWAREVLTQKNIFSRLLLWPFFLFPKIIVSGFPVTTGTDLAASLIKNNSDLGVKWGFLGGQEGVVQKLVRKLEKDHPNINIVLAENQIYVNQEGEVVEGGEILEKILNTPIDILLVAFGQIKQEKFMARYLDKSNARVMIGVGGAFDYLSGSVPRAPKLVCQMGFEWLFRLIVQPWRIKRFFSLVEFVIRVLRGN